MKASEARKITGKVLSAKVSIDPLRKYVYQRIEGAALQGLSSLHNPADG